MDNDVAAAIEEEKRRQGGGLSAIVNRLIRRGLLETDERRPFVQQTAPLALRVDVMNIAETLEQLDGPTAR